MPLPALRQYAFLFALAPLLCACSGKAPAAQAVEETAVSGGISYGLAELPPAACRVGDAAAAQGRWVEARSGGTQYVDGIRQVNAGFGEPRATNALRAVLDRQALQDLARVEFQDADGNWHDAWTGKPSLKAAQGCDNAWFAQRLAGKAQAVRALRFSFRPAAGDVAVGHASVHTG